MEKVFSIKNLCIYCFHNYFQVRKENMSLINSFLWPFNIYCENVAFSYNNKQNFHLDRVQRMELYLLCFVLLLIWKMYSIKDAWVSLEAFNFCSWHYKKPLFLRKELVTVMCNINSHLKHFPSCITTSALYQPLFLPLLQDSVLSLNITFESCKHIST